jgi:Holliday junction resolvase RusA-like endonuclease
VISFTIPGAPRGWARTGHAKGGHVFVDKKTASYENQVAHLASLALEGRDPMEGPLRVVIHVRLGMAESWSKKKRDALEGCLATKKPDADNASKVILDGLNGVAYKDDVQVCELIITKRWARHPNTHVTVAPARDLLS